MQNSMVNNLFKVNIKLKCVTIFLLVISADWLFFEEKVGWTAGLFTVLLCLAYVMHSSAVHLNSRAKLIVLLIVGQAFALILDPNGLSLLLVFMGFVGLAYVQLPYIHNNARYFLRFMCRYLFKSWLGIFRDYAVYSKYKRKHGANARNVSTVLNNWLLPIGLSLLFVLLFSHANPVIEGWFDSVDPRRILRVFSVRRLLFWAVILVVAWAMLRPHQIMRKVQYGTKPKRVARQSIFLTPSSIMRALVLFNIIFFMQSMMDMMYLWGGASLPDGMSYAAYAHRGAYPLIVTALLAALFVLVALKPGSESEKSHLIRVMVYAWVGQNIVLVISCVWRTMLYIEAYQLTYMRITAIIWMALVAVGLTLIIIRLAKQHSNIWLINRNFMALMVTLYLCSFVNFGGMIAEYNITHSKQVAGVGKVLDVYYLTENVGIEALPILVKYENKLYPNKVLCDPLSDNRCHGVKARFKHAAIQKMARRLEYQMKGWRSWSFRKHRISKVLEQGTD